MKIKLTRDAGGNKAGATIERTDSVAQLLINHGAAEEIEADEKPKPKRRSTASKAKGDADESEADE